MFDSTEKLYSVRIDLGDRNSSWTKIIDLVTDGSAVLEVGCAQGDMSAVLAAEKRCTVTGIEVNPVAAAAARRYCHRVVTGDVEHGAFDELGATFDVVILADVLEHLRSPGRVLRATQRLLGRDGYVIISLPNVAHWDVRRAILRGEFEYTNVGILDDTHLRFFTYESALRLIRTAGYDVVWFDLVHRCPRDWKYVRFYRRLEQPIHRLVKRYFPGLFGYQFIFKAVPTERAPSLVGAMG
jgi:2-polyprenyl-3-methyl-5-hydroxy-6-metoxy-1,4-benzoquinol methylase